MNADLHDAVVSARKAWDGWANRPSSNRGQIFYRMAELLEHRASEMIEELGRSKGSPPMMRHREVQATIDRLIWYAGWADKVAQLFGSVNSVSSSHFNYSVPESMGVIAVIAPDEPALLGLVSVVAPILISGNTVVVLASEKHPFGAIALSEIFATSDLPSGVMNVLTGFRAELGLAMARHMDINAIVDASGDRSLRARIQMEAACNVKRTAFRDLEIKEWFGEEAADPYWMLDTLEIKTTWHPMGF